MADPKKTAPVAPVASAPVASAPVQTEKKKRRKSAPENESKADKFRRLATVRVSKALKIMGYIAAIGNKSNYDYTPEQFDKIKTALAGGLQRIEIAFSGKKKEENGFQL